MRNLPAIIEFFDTRNVTLEELAHRAERLADELCGGEKEVAGDTPHKSPDLPYCILSSFEGRFERQTQAIDRLAYALGRLDGAIGASEPKPTRSTLG